MTEETALIPKDQLPASRFDDKALEAANQTNKWLPRLQLMTSKSEKCSSGEFPINNYALIIGQEYVDLGPSIDVLVCASRPKAMLLGDEVTTIFDPKPDAKGNATGEFARIQQLANSTVEEERRGALYGCEFLIYIPQAKKFAGLFMCTKTARNEVKFIRAREGYAATLKSKKIPSTKYTPWYAVQCLPCNTPFEIPPMDEIRDQVHQFNNPPEKIVDVVDEGAETGRAR